jgi:hypothetical protein
MKFFPSEHGHGIEAHHVSFADDQASAKSSRSDYVNMTFLNIAPLDASSPIQRPLLTTRQHATVHVSPAADSHLPTAVLTES